MQPEKTKKEKQRIRTQTMKMWQEMWEASTKGRTTYTFMDNVGKRVAATWIRTNHYTVQLISGHGNIVMKLQALGLSTSDSCNCGIKDTIEHIVFECEETQELRTKLIEQTLKNGTRWPCTMQQLVNVENCLAFHQFATSAMKEREDRERQVENRRQSSATLD